MSHIHGARAKWYMPIGRVLMALLFIIAGWGKITGFAGAVGMVAAAGFPMPTVMTVLAIIFEFGGGVMLLLGFHARLAAWMLIVFTAIATLGYHMDWSNQMNMIMALKNLAIIGGLLYVAKIGAGGCSLAKHNTSVCMGSNMCPDCSACHCTTCDGCASDAKKA
jgi:putative oxidoreductase